MKVRIYRDKKTGRIMKQEGYSLSYYWSETMLDYLRRNFSTTTNRELAEWLGMSQITVTRKAHALGLRKDAKWMVKMSRRNGNIGAMVNRIKGNAGMIKKGEHRNPAGEFKPGYVMTEERKALQSEYMKQWCKERKRRALVAQMKKANGEAI